MIDWMHNIVFYLDSLQNHAIVMSRCMHYIFCLERELKKTWQECPTCDENRG